ncbi:alpha-L-fucosidase [Pedomonas mirosovicensis]|uniref:alpha-L-fucosidase n=1 Tax=Pedomonas mirosovicensis TaxID=2908641 RepID=UPI0021679CFD|nr:alpha-L-fucosidase [Pedomonas mirosovicensis]MCH8686629.1 alpha-L-fucosidase [Pedomonas mirosovicensis]
MAAASVMLGPAVSRAAQPVAANWQAFAAVYQAPQWFRDAKFGIWSHWGPQCVPEAGDWYGRLMYVQGSPAYEHHVRAYGHPSERGFLEIIGQWKAEHWCPEDLLARFQRAGARYIVSMANHHDNFDNFNSAHHPWNSTRVGPKRDIVGTWEKLVRQAGLKFGVSNHSSHAWHWWQTAYGYDAEGERKGRRYDAHWLRKSHGKGRWWEGLDPQELYTGPAFVPPDGLDSTAAINAWHEERDGQWIEHTPPHNSDFARTWLLRQMDLVEKYRPDLVYFDNYRLPFGQTGIDAVAHYYNKSLEWHGAINVVLTAKRLSLYQSHAIVEDVERGFLDEIRPVPWQTCTCIGNWHYDRALYERHGYRSAKYVAQRLCDVVSKNGNLLLSIPQRGDGSIDTDEEKILDDLAAWFAINGDGIYGTQPWRVFGEGPTRPPVGMQSEHTAKPFTAGDVRFTAGKGVLNAFFLDGPQEEASIVSLGRQALPDAVIEQVELAGGSSLAFRREDEALRITMPPGQKVAFVPSVRIYGRGLV